MKIKFRHARKTIELISLTEYSRLNKIEKINSHVTAGKILEVMGLLKPLQYNEVSVIKKFEKNKYEINNLAIAESAIISNENARIVLFNSRKYINTQIRKVLK